MGEVTMPRLSDTMEEGAVGRWLKQPGEAVQSGEILAEIETDKATMELEAFESGTLQQILIPAGQTVAIGTVIAMIGANGSTPMPSTPPPAAAAAAPPPSKAQVPLPAAAPPQHEEPSRLLVSPVARRIADERGIDLRQVQGSGPGGRIIKENVEAFVAQAEATDMPTPPAPPAPAPAPTPPPVAAPTPAALPAAPQGAEVEPLSRMRRAIARAMNEAKPGIPHIYVTIEVAMEAALALREQINQSGAAPEKISLNDIVVAAAARALRTVPAVNSSLVSGPDGQPARVRHSAINVSVAVALEDGLIAPVVRDADQKSIGTISSTIRALAGRARAGTIRQNELEGATFQVTNLGMFGVTEFGSIITAPQAASLAVGSVRSVPVVRGEQVVPGQVLNLTLSADHRIIDGAVAAHYLQALKALLEAPIAILI